MERLNERDYRYAQDGTLLVQKPLAARWGIPGSVFSGKKGWYRCSSGDPDRHYRRMVLFGWSGWHRFQERRFLSGSFYLFTCGCFGVFYFYDLALMLAGNYSYREASYREREAGLERQVRKVYYAPLEDRKKGFLLLGLAVSVFLAVFLCLYQPLGMALVRFLLGAFTGKGMEDAVSGFFRIVL